MLASPMITWSLRYLSGSACGSSRGLGEAPAALVPRRLRPELPGAREHLPRHEERREIAHYLAERGQPVHQVVLVRAVRVPLAVGVILVDRQAFPRWKDPVELVQRALQHALPGPVVDDALPHFAAL